MLHVMDGKKNVIMNNIESEEEGGQRMQIVVIKYGGEKSYYDSLEESEEK